MNFDGIIGVAKGMGPKRMVVIGESTSPFLSPVFDAYNSGLIDPVFIGRGNFDLDYKKFECIQEPDMEKARIKGLNMVKDGEGQIFIELDLMGPGLFAMLNKKKSGIKKGKILSYISFFESLKDGRLSMMTDTYINDYPDIKDKVDIVENAIDVANILDIRSPKIAALAALELVNPALISTIDAAALSKMSERGQFGAAIVEGPLAMDNAESASAARHKGINSPVPGDVDIYLFPDIESAYLTSQFLFILGKVRHAGILGGVNIPIVTLTPLDTKSSCLFNIALAVLQ